MALNIKNSEAHRLARELAEAKGTSLTEAVTEALRESLDAVVSPSEPNLLLQEVAEIQRFIADLPDRESRSPDEILGYDDLGLPE